ncbi:MAG: hypothetical protein HQK81_13860 [Desulfovibrionaceae bacterium]|nr:hypothetical protein [Desulfovibrionaceae bacterium]MBF0515129.1 hypothetical protein [Desulfovibrionaceae bacterium]
MTSTFPPFFYPNDPSEIREALRRIPRAVAAPSFVWPGTAAQNCRMLAGIFPEVALLFFESRACLEYGDDDLPAWLDGLGLAYHLHLPLDLPWRGGAAAAFRVAAALADKAAFLRPARFVLHPPREARELAAFAALWTAKGLAPESLAIENTQAAPLKLHWPLIRELGLGVCLDLGHVLAYGQESSLALPGLAAALRLVHLSAPRAQGHADSADSAGSAGHGHFSLARLSADGRAVARDILNLAPADAVIVLEIFEPAGLCRSVAVLEELCAKASEVANIP